MGGSRNEHRKLRKLTGRDKAALTAMAGIPALLTTALIWIPAVGSIVLSFSKWNGIGGFGDIKWIGGRNYHDITHSYPPFTPAWHHNLIWFAVFVLVPAPLGLYLATQLDKRIKGSRIYQNIFFLPVVLSLALVGFMVELIYAPEQGLINNLTGHTKPGNLVDWIGNPHLNLFAVLTLAVWRQTGYVMILWLAGLKAVDPALREAAALDGADEWQAFRHVVLPSLRPVTIVVSVITVVETLRAFDIVYVVNRGKNGLELLSTLVTDNIVGEAIRIGFGSALASILLVVSLLVIVPYLIVTFRRDD
ncbi:MAG: sugar ABC transporter permease [Catenulisporales bacterium]|jgi:ABC-type sugar transport system permease subunit|nr:sugar ABC transporter permease [Catenulisporales bacterium]